MEKVTSFIVVVFVATVFVKTSAWNEEFWDTTLDEWISCNGERCKELPTSCPECPVGHCDRNPNCLHGNCTSTADGYTCTCECGWTGMDCDTEEECGASPRGSNVCTILGVVLLGYVLL